MDDKDAILKQLVQELRTLNATQKQIMVHLANLAASVRK